MKSSFMRILAFVLCLTVVPSVRAQWSSDPLKNLALADNANGSDHVQPKVRPLPNNQWYVSWFDADPSTPKPIGYDVFFQRLDATGVEQFAHGGAMVADLSNSFTEDYGLDIDTAGNALLAFLDTRWSPNQQVSASKMSPSGQPLWGKKGVQLTFSGTDFNASPRITGTTDGNVVVAWTTNSNTYLQKLDPNGHAIWNKPRVLEEPGFNYFLSDLHASDKGSVIVSWVRSAGFSGAKQLRANKLSANGWALWGKKGLSIYDAGSLQFGEFPYFFSDGSGGAVFSWYSASPSLQVFAQHIRANGKEAFPHNGSPGSNNSFNVRVEPSVSYNAVTDETFLFWTEEDSNQFTNGVSGQKFDGTGAQKWGSGGLTIVPLGADSQIFVKNVQIGSGALVIWDDSPTFGQDTLQAVKLNGAGKTICAQFPVSTTLSSKFGLSMSIAPSGLTTVAWADNRIGNNAIYVQDVKANCKLGQ